MQREGGREQTGEEKGDWAGAAIGDQKGTVRQSTRDWEGTVRQSSGDQKGTVRRSTRDREGLCANASLEVSPVKVHRHHTEPTEGEEPAMGSQIRQGAFLIRGHVLCTRRSW